ncbi:P-II family nitrogen regulator [Litoreibacter roseus]|uniref:Nitrogen regulatory protein P-II n=1 Tax=Litoreibacter roseus TaxID=2601869 RepID=A0A6N6JEQ9_9RHOB|nr:transcriptional regulator [Litoreibacter roseus]GFE64706.1 hypothetical protein KIN_17800 [Litoreibacter roseus]
MQTHPAKRVEIIIEAPAQRRLVRAMNDAGIDAYTILPVLGGSGRSGRWSRDGQVSTASGMISVTCILRSDRLDGLLNAALEVVERHIGVVSVTDCEVLRAERF